MKINSRVHFSRVAAATLLLTAFAGSASADCEHKADRSLTEDLAGVERVEIKATAGDLDIEAGGSQLKATGEACASKKSLLDDIQLTAKKSGDVLRVEATIPKTSGWNQQARLDLRITLPAGMPIVVSDGSGDLEMRGVTVEKLDDGSGDARLVETRGSMRIVDGSGGVTIRDHRGDIELKDGSGDLRLRGIKGTVIIASDGSGDIDINDVDGDVDVKNDGSGDIDVDTVSGDLHVGPAGSGDVDYRDVAGSVEVPRRR